MTWVFNSTLAARQQNDRRIQIAAATRELDRIEKMLRGKRRRPRTLHDLNKRVASVIAQHGVKDYVIPETAQFHEEHYLAERGGHIKPETRYRRVLEDKLRLSWRIDEDAVRRNAKMDGLYPLLTNDPSLSAEDVLKAHKGQPRIEKRFQQMKGVFEIAPVFLKSEARIEAFFTLFFIAMVIQAVIERRLRRAMQRRNITALPLYPERRQCRHPTADQVFRLFSHVERHHLIDDSRRLKTFDPELTPLQLRALELLDISPRAYAVA